MTPPLAQLAPLFTNAGLAAAGAAAIAIPLAIHLLTRLRRRQQPWAAMRFLIEAYRRQRQRLRLEQWLLLLVRCLVLIVLGLALAGPLMGGLGRHLGAGAAGRVVCLAIDDSLSTQAELDAGGNRFEALRRQAIRIIDSLGAADRIAIWRVAHPGRAELAPPTVDHDRARQLLVAMKPRYSAADWTGALASIGSMLSQQELPADRATVVMLSDFSVSTLDPDRPLPPEAAAVGRQARLLVSRPMPEAGNVQIAALSLRRQMVVAETNRPTTIAAQLRLRRFATEQPDAATGVDLSLTGDDGKPIATLHRDHRWSAGQTVAVLDIEVPVSAAWLKSASAPKGGAGMTLTLRATIDVPAGADALAADNQRVVVVELRRRLMVGMLDESAAINPSDQWFHRPSDWLRLALTPESRTTAGTAASPTGPIEVTSIAAPVADEASLSGVDAAMVLRPDLLGPRGWTALRNLAQRGGLVWIFVPPTSNALGWPDMLKQQFGLNWKLGLSPRVAGADENAGWTLASDTVPEPLALLGGDWPALLRPVRVFKRLDLNVSGTPGAPGVSGNQDAAWLRVVATNAPTTAARAIGDTNTLLAGAPAGDGYVLLFAVALDTTWTNLPTKPLFVPLLHEMLRGLLGSAGDATRLSRLTCGDQPLLGRRWDGAQEMISASGNATPLRRSDQGLQPVAPLEEPGVYAARPGAELKLAVNVDERAGDTQALDGDALARWLRGLGNWAWIDPARPELAMVANSPRTDLGWPLLWATLALLLIETGLARWFSHAKV